MIDVSKIKEGDEVLIRGVVTRAKPDRDGDLGGNFTPRPGANVYFHANNIVEHFPRSIKIGDRVHLKSGVRWSEPGEVIAVDGTDAWVRVVPGFRQTFKLADLERVT